jgi:hypothetical protein
MQITWTISQLDRRTSDGFVTTAHWQCNGVDGDFSASIYSTCGWSEGVPVTPYDALTQETVLGWVWANGVDKNATEASVMAQIEAQKNPVQVSGIPW